MSSTDQSQKTEEPTPRKLEEARKRGELVKSQDVSIWFGFLGIAVMAVLMGGVTRGLNGPLRAFLERPHEMPVSGPGFTRLSWEIFGAVMGSAGILFLVGFLAALIGQLAQAQPVFTAAKLKPDLSRLNPISGFGRLFGRDALTRWLKDVLKLTAIGFALWSVIGPRQKEFDLYPGLDPAALPKLFADLAGQLLTASLIVIGMVAALDYFLQYRSHIRRNRMSRQELLEELKESEGDPQLKARLRQIRQERSKRRMIQAVPTATVIVTNPTHYAVALRYVEAETPAPICVAKGVDAVALRIRAIAEENKVPVLEDPPLARALFATADIDAPIPRQHYEAVAKIIGFIMNLETAKSRNRQIRRPE